MKFTITKEELLKPLQMLAGVIERRQTLPILANVLIKVQAERVALIGTDLEVELVAYASFTAILETGEITVSARKLMDISRGLTEKTVLSLQVERQRLTIQAEKSRFALATISAQDFPRLEQEQNKVEFDLAQQELNFLLKNTHFAMAQQDVRYYLNGVLLEIRNKGITAVATDGHRLAIATLEKVSSPAEKQIILPRKGVMELLRLLTESEQQVSILLTATYIKIVTDSFIFISKLIEGQYPDYQRLMAKNGDKRIVIDKENLRLALSRVSILSHEKQRGILLQLSLNSLKIKAKNNEQEEAEEEIAIDYEGADLDISFNVVYLLDALNVLPLGEVELYLSDANSSLLLKPSDNTAIAYVVMPMRL